MPAVSGATINYFSEYPVADKRRWQTHNPQEHYIVMLSTQAANRRSLVGGKFAYQQQPQALELAAALAAFLAVPVSLYDAPSKPLAPLQTAHEAA